MRLADVTRAVGIRSTGPAQKRGAVIPTLFMPLLLVHRIKVEEELLSKELRGYASHMADARLRDGGRRQGARLWLLGRRLPLADHVQPRRRRKPHVARRISSGSALVARRPGSAQAISDTTLSINSALTNATTSVGLMS